MTGSIAEAIKEGFALWKTYISTREKSYIRKMDKSKRLAIEYAERFIHRCKDLGIEDKELSKYSKKFFKYN